MPTLDDLTPDDAYTYQHQCVRAAHAGPSAMQQAWEQHALAEARLVEGQQRLLAWVARHAPRPCDLCRTLTPVALLRPEAYQEWDALCPACFSLATAHTALELAREAAAREGNTHA